MRRLLALLVFTLLTVGCGRTANRTPSTPESPCEEVLVGATDTTLYLPLLEGKRVALLANHTARIGDQHLVDMLHRRGILVTGIFAPEHGFRGGADAGEVVRSEVDPKTGIPIRSLYEGRTLRPSDEAMQSFDLLVVDMQDVGVRFYTYHIAMLRMMEAAADFRKEVIILDRPNPHGDKVDGPILDTERYKSGVGILPIPVLHGLTMGEIAHMAIGEGWCKACALKVIRCRHYTHSTPYSLPIPPSPNLPTDQAVALYPSLCLFEGSSLSVGRGTEHPFSCFGHPDLEGVEPYEFSFTPHPCYGAKEPLHNGRTCYGVDLRDTEAPDHLSLGWLVDAYRALGGGESFFKPIFEKLIGVGYVREMIIRGASAEEIEARWQEEVAAYRVLRSRYLLYDE